MTLSKSENRLLLALALFGLLVPNGIFIYFSIAEPQLLTAALSNPIAAVFVAEAFLLMFLFAWLLPKLRPQGPKASLFVALSIIGGLIFSVPLTIRTLAGEKRTG